MSQASIENRLDRLEKTVDEVLLRLGGDPPKEKNWRRTVGMFDGDPIMKEVIDEALHAREKERAQYYQQYDREVEPS